MANHIPDAREHLTSHADLGTSYFWIQEGATTKDIPAQREVIEFDSEMKLGKALHTLADNGILSAPVFDKSANKYLGFVDVFDLMTLAVGVDMLMHILPDDMVKKPRTEDDFKKHAEMSLSEMLSQGNEGFCPFVPVEEGAPFRLVVHLLATKTRRVPVISKETGKVIQVISQSQIVSLLYERVKASNVLTDSSPGTTGLGIKPVFSVKDSQTARDAFQLMVENNVSSVAVVDDRGNLETAISTKDIRLLPRLESAGASRNNIFDMNVREFAATIRRLTEKDGKSHAAIVTVGANTPLLHVLGKLSVTKMHRVYVQDDHHKPMGVISVSDVMVALEQIQPDQQ